MSDTETLFKRCEQLCEAHAVTLFRIVLAAEEEEYGHVLDTTTLPRGCVIKKIKDSRGERTVVQVNSKHLSDTTVQKMRTFVDSLSKYEAHAVRP